MSDNPLSCLGFYWLCFKRAFTGSWPKADAIYGGIIVAVLVPVMLWLMGYEVLIPNKKLSQIIYFCGIFFIVFAYRFLLCPYLLWKEKTQETKDIKQQLAAISTERYLVFSELSIGFKQTRKLLFDFSVSLIIENIGEKLLKYKLHKVSVLINGINVTPAYKLSSNEAFIHARQPAEYALPPILNVAVGHFPIEIVVEALFEYDNQPPLQPRTTGRTIRRDYTSVAPVIFRQYIVDTEES